MKDAAKKGKEGKGGIRGKGVVGKGGHESGKGRLMALIMIIDEMVAGPTQQIT